MSDTCAAARAADRYGCPAKYSADRGGCAHPRKIGHGGTVIPKLMAVSDIHVGHQGNKPVVEQIRPDSPEDWLIVAGDVGEILDDIDGRCALLRERFAKVIWAPGNHELWTPRQGPGEMQGRASLSTTWWRCAASIDIATPEDPYPVWRGPGGDGHHRAAVRALRLLLQPARPDDQGQGAAPARTTRVSCATDEFLLHPTRTRPARRGVTSAIAETERFLAARDETLPTVLVNHFPLVRDPTRSCGTRSSRCGAARNAPRTGTCASTR